MGFRKVGDLRWLHPVLVAHDEAVPDVLVSLGMMQRTKLGCVVYKFAISLPSCSCAHACNTYILHVFTFISVIVFFYIKFIRCNVAFYKCRCTTNTMHQMYVRQRWFVGPYPESAPFAPFRRIKSLCSPKLSTFCTSKRGLIWDIIWPFVVTKTLIGPKNLHFPQLKHIQVWLNRAVLDYNTITYKLYALHRIFSSKRKCDY